MKNWGARFPKYFAFDVRAQQAHETFQKKHENACVRLTVLSQVVTTTFVATNNKKQS